MENELAATRARSGGEAAKAASAEIDGLRRENDTARARCDAMERDAAKAGRDAASRRVMEQAKHQELERERSARASLENEKDSFAKQRKEIVRHVFSLSLSLALALSLDLPLSPLPSAPNECRCTASAR